MRDSSTFDVFLSHSYDDAEVILGVKKIMESIGLKVYVDWIDDAGLDRGNVTRKTAAILRMRMRNSSSLVYAHSESSGDSKWMPWEWDITMASGQVVYGCYRLWPTMIQNSKARNIWGFTRRLKRSLTCMAA